MRASQLGDARLGRVVAACKRTARIPAQRGHEHAFVCKRADEVRIGGEQARVLDGAHGHVPARFQARADVRRGARLRDAVGVRTDLIVEMAHDVAVERDRLLGGELVVDEAGEALRPRDFPHLVEREVAAVIVELGVLGGGRVIGIELRMARTLVKQRVE